MIVQGWYLHSSHLRTTIKLQKRIAKENNVLNKFTVVLATFTDIRSCMSPTGHGLARKALPCSAGAIAPWCLVTDCSDMFPPYSIVTLPSQIWWWTHHEHCCPGAHEHRAPSLADGDVTHPGLGSPLSTCSRACWFVIPGYGQTPRLKVSHRRMPKLHTSLSELYLPEREEMVIAR